MPYRIHVVLVRGVPSKIGQLVVRTITVTVTAKCSFGPWTYEGFQDKNVNTFYTLTLVLGEPHYTVATF